MGDIVATIQGEQDAIIRSELGGALVVQGGPGTGKTAVALHRAAYLLYAHRRMLERSGVLLVGPSRTFLRYIDQVLPSLGETGVVTTTIAELVPGHPGDRPPRTRPSPSSRAARCGAASSRAPCATASAIPAQPVHVRVDGHDLVIRPNDIASAMARARRNHKPHNQARVSFVRDMLGRLAEQYVVQLGGDVPADERGEIIEELRTTREIRVALNLAWMPITPQKLVADLWSKPHRLASAAPAAARRSSARCSCATPTRRGRRPTSRCSTRPPSCSGEDDQAARAEARAAVRAPRVRARVRPPGARVDGQRRHGLGRDAGGPVRRRAARR